MPSSKSKVNLLLNLLSDGAVKLVAGSKVRVFYQPVAYLVRVLGVMLGDVFLVDVAHADYNFCPLQQLRGQTLGAVGATVVPQLFEGETHLTWDLT